MSRPPLPPFDLATAAQKSAWPRTPGTRAIPRASLWPIRPTAAGGTAPNFAGARGDRGLSDPQMGKEQDYRLIKEIWAFRENRIAVRFAYEWRDAEGNWFRAYGNENWEFDEDGLMRLRIASINDAPLGGKGSPVPLAAWPPARRSPVSQRSRTLKAPPWIRPDNSPSSDVAFTPIGQGGAGAQRFALDLCRRRGARRLADPRHPRTRRHSSRRRPAFSWRPPVATASPISSIAEARRASCACWTKRRSALSISSATGNSSPLGNLAENDQAQLFLIDYATRRRIKIWGTARVVEGDEALTGETDAAGLSGASRPR